MIHTTPESVSGGDGLDYMINGINRTEAELLLLAERCQRRGQTIDMRYIETIGEAAKRLIALCDKLQAYNGIVDDMQSPTEPS